MIDRLEESRRLYQQGRFADADPLCRALLAEHPESPRGWYLHALIAFRLGQAELAAERISEAIRLAPQDPEILTHGSELLRRAGRFADAIQAATRATELWAQHPAPYNNLGLAFNDDGQVSQSETCFRKAIAIDPQYVRAHLNLGNVLHGQHRTAEARACFAEALRIRPDYPEALNSAGQLAKELGNPTAAVRLLQRAIQVRPGYPKARLNLANALAELRHYDQAEELLRSLTSADPNYAEAFHDLGALYERQKRVADAVAAYTRFRELQPESAHALAALENAKRNICDWTDWPDSIEELVSATRQLVSEGKPSPLLPLVSCRFPTTSADRLEIAKRHASRYTVGADSIQLADPARCRADFEATGRIKVGFLSHEFRYHVVSHLMMGMYHRFDRDQFEVFAFDYSPDDGSEMRQEVSQRVDHFVDVSSGTDHERAAQIAAAGVHVLLDINSYMPGGRPGIAAHRPAPVQVIHMYPATSGAPHIDYFLTDPVVTPPGQEQFYTEQLIYLPCCYLPTDSDQVIDDATPTRSECGLPEDAFVFCSFNKSDKIEPRVFDIWMRVLSAVPESVLWLRNDGEAAATNLRREATARGIDPERLCFATEVPGIPQHLARQRNGDLFLDTLTHGAHGTAVDALWAGLPLLTCPGDTFTARVAASLLTAVGMEELIVETLEEYEQTAIELAHNPDRARSLRERLEQQRAAGTLLSTDRYTRNVERALAAAWDRFLQGEDPAPIHIEEA